MRKLVKQALDIEPKALSCREALREIRYFILSMLSLLLSMLFPAVELQLITLSIVIGAKWIVDSRKTNILIIERSRP